MTGLIARRELRAHLHGFTFWLLLASAHGLLAWLLFAQLDAYQKISAQLIAAQSNLGINDLVIAPTMNSLGILLLLLTPLLSMHALAEEKRSGHLKVLLGSGLAPAHLVLGKWLGNTLAGLLILASGLLIPLTLILGSQLDWQRLAVNATSLLLLVMMASAIGVMFSAATRHAAAAFAASAGLLLSLWLLDSLVPPTTAGYWLALNPHLERASSGTLTIADMTYFGLLTAAPLLVAGVLLGQARAARHPGPVRIPLFIVLVAACTLSAGSLLQRFNNPILQAPGSHLSETLRQTLDALQGPVVVTAFAPELPLLRKRINKLIEPLQQHYPQLELKFVDPRKQPHLAQAQEIEHDGELVIEGLGRQQRVNSLSPAALERALTRLAHKGSPWVVALQGQGEADINNTAASGLSAFTALLEKQGYRVVGFNPLSSTQIPHNTAFVLVAAGRQDYAANSVQILQQYLDDGGRMLWLHEGDNGLALQKISGVQALPGTVVDPSSNRVGLASMRQLPLSRFPGELLPRVPQQYAVLNDAIALTANEAWQSIATLQTGDQAWNETGSPDRHAQRNPLYGEQQGPLTVGVALQKAQARLVVMGDSDFVRNDQLGIGSNRALALGLVNWLTGNQLSTASPADDLAVNWSVTSAATAAAIHLFGLPLAYLLGGLLVRWRRTRR